MTSVNPWWAKGYDKHTEPAAISDAGPRGAPIPPLIWLPRIPNGTRGFNGAGAPWAGADGLPLESRAWPVVNCVAVFAPARDAAAVQRLRRGRTQVGIREDFMRTKIGLATVAIAVCGLPGHSNAQ